MIAKTNFDLTEMIAADPNWCHMKLVLQWANKWQRPAGLDVADLVQIGFLCLVRCIRSFNSDFGVQFGTYLVEALKKEYYKACSDHASIIRVPSYIRIDCKNGDRPRRYPQAAASADKAMRLTRKDEMPDQGRNDRNLTDWINRADIAAALEQLTWQEAEVVRLHWGLDGGTPLSDTTIAHMRRLWRGRIVCKSNVKHVRHRALQKLRALLQ